MQDVRAFVDHLTIFAILSDSGANVTTVTVGTAIIVICIMGTASATTTTAFRAERNIYQRLVEKHKCDT